MANKLTGIPVPPSLRKPEIPSVDDFLDSEQRERKRWGLLDDYLLDLYSAIVILTQTKACECFRWIYSTLATVDDTGLGAQTDFPLPLPYELEDSIYHILFARTSFGYYNVDYTINVATNTVTIPAGVALGWPLTIYAVRHDDIQDIEYHTVAGGVTPYVHSPAVTVDRAPGRQLVFARSSPRFLDSGRPGDEYTVSNTANTISITSGLGTGHRAAVVRLREGCTKFHEEIIATAAGQTLFQISNLDNRIQPHATGKLIVFKRTSFMHPGVDYTTDPASNTIQFLGAGVAIGHPINIWCYH